MTSLARTIAWVFAAAGFVLVNGCGNSDVEKAGQSHLAQRTPGGSEAGGSAAPNSVAGMQWQVPEGWRAGPSRAMRVATYLIDDGDETAECAVFFFGPSQGGSVQDNLDRWIGQFSQPDGGDSKLRATTNERAINGLPVTTVDLTGTYAAGMGGAMGARDALQEGYRLLGAIVTAPEGLVFFKLTGPEDAVSASAPAFEQLISSVDKS